MPALQLVVHGAVAIDSLPGVLECVATLANYAERAAAELAMRVASEKLARHSPAFGIDGFGLSRYRGSIWCHRPVRDPPWIRQRPKTFGNHSFLIMELPHERRDRR